MSDHLTVDHHVKRKKRKTGDESFSENVSYSEHSELERPRKKKKKHRSTDGETSIEYEVSSLDNPSSSYRHSSPVNCVKQEVISDSSNRDSNFTPRKSKSSKKKKRIDVSVAETLEETDHTGQPSLYDGHSEEVTVSEEALLSESGRKMKKRHRHFEEEDVLEDIQQTSEVSRSSEKKKHVSAQKSSSELATAANSTFSDERETKADSYLSPNVRGSQNVTVAEDTSFNGQTDVECSERKKKKRKHQRKEHHSQTESSMCRLFKKDSNQEPIGKDDKMVEESGKEREENLDAFEEETFENIINDKPDDDVGTPAKTNKSVRNRDQDVNAELEELEEDEMENTLEEETRKENKKRVWSKQRRLPESASEVLGSIRKADAALLEEFFPKIRSMGLKTVKEYIGNELKRIKEAKENGIAFRTGRFDSTEDEIIKKNVEEFIEIVGLESGEMLFHSYRFPDEKSTVEKIKKTYHFRQRIAIGLARTVEEVHNRGAKLYDLTGNKGRFTKEEVAKLQKEISIHGNDWITIGSLVGRNNKSIQLKASQLRQDVTGGKWSNDEVNRLIQAVKGFILSSMKNKKGYKASISEPKTVPKEMLFTGIPWAKIEKAVKTRNWAHCKSKWNDVLLLRMNDGISPFDGVIGLQTNIEMIKWLHEANLPKGRVNWKKMAKAMGNVPPGILQQKVYKLKSRNVPDWQSLSFKEIVDYLYTELVPKLEERGKCSHVSQEELDMPERKDNFLISDIFKEYVCDEKNNLSKTFCMEN